MYSNPLVLEILSILKDTDKHLSLYQLMQILEKAGFDLVKSPSSESSEIKLFRKNFIVMNALYQINQDINGSGYCLFISSLKIYMTEEGGNHQIQAEDISSESALSDYYLDWDNFYLTDKAGVEKLLYDFWARYSDSNALQNDKRLDSLQVLGLESSASWKDIQQAYRQLISVYHPDKGGNSLRFIQVRQAFLILKLTY